MTNIFSRTIIPVDGYPGIRTVGGFIFAIEQAGGVVDRQAIDVMISPGFTMPGKGSANGDFLAIIAFKQCSSPNSEDLSVLPMSGIYGAAGNADLRLCSGRSGLELCLQLINNQAKGKTNNEEELTIEEGLIIAIHPVMGYDSGNSALLEITRDKNVFRLGIYPVPHDKLFPGKSLWVFREKTE